MKESKEFTKEEVKFVIQNWEKMTSPELGKALNRHPGSITYLANRIRKAGYALPKRNKTNRTILLVREVLKELKLI